MLSRFTKALMVLSLTILFSAPQWAAAASSEVVVVEKPTALAMTGDVLLARPALLATTILGTAVFLVSLPFSVLGGNVGEAASNLVGKPAAATFVRCLGCKNTGYKKKVKEKRKKKRQTKR